MVAGLVNDRLLGSTDCEEEVNEGGSFFYLEDAADKIVEQLSRKDVASRAQCSLNFQPLELKYLIRGEDFNSDGLGPGSSDSRHNGNASSGHSQLHFTYSGETPDFISKACKSLEDRQITDQKNKNMPAIGKNRDSFKHLLPGDNSSSSGSYGSSGGSSASSSYISGIARARTLPPASSRPGISSSFTGGSQGNGQRQASKMMMLDQVDLRMQQSASAGLSGVSEGSSSSLKRKGPSTAGELPRLDWDQC